MIRMIPCVLVVLLTASALAQSSQSGFQPSSVDPAVPQPSAMFAAIDTDGDGVITKAELRKAIVALRKLDADKDGKITIVETQSLGNATNGNPPTGFGDTNRFGGPGGFGPNGDPRPGGPDMIQFDRNRDGRISADEVPPHLRGALGSADQNRNGVLDASELRAIQQRINERTRGQRALPPGVTIGPQGVDRTQ